MLNLEWRLLEISSVVTNSHSRELEEEHVTRLMKSFKQFRSEVLLQPIIVDAEFNVVDGMHRLEAARRSGWSHISAAVVATYSDAATRVAGFEANTLRRSFTPVELEQMWMEYEHFLLENSKSTPEDGASVKKDTGVTEKFGNDKPGSDQGFVLPGKSSRALLIKNITGLSEKTIDKVTEIRILSESKTAPKELVEAAKNEIIKLSIPATKTKVETSHRMLLSLKRNIDVSNHSDKNLQQQLLSQKLNQLLIRSIGLAEVLSGKGGDEIHRAASLSTSNAQDLAASRKALTIALAQIMVIESRTNKNPLRYISEVAPGLHRQIAEHIYEQMHGHASKVGTSRAGTVKVDSLPKAKITPLQRR